MCHIVAPLIFLCRLLLYSLPYQTLHTFNEYNYYYPDYFNTTI